MFSRQLLCVAVLFWPVVSFVVAIALGRALDVAEERRPALFAGRSGGTP